MSTGLLVVLLVDGLPNGLSHGLHRCRDRVVALNYGRHHLHGARARTIQMSKETLSSPPTPPPPSCAPSLV